MKQIRNKSKKTIALVLSLAMAVTGTVLPVSAFGETTSGNGSYDSLFSKVAESVSDQPSQYGYRPAEVNINKVDKSRAEKKAAKTNFPEKLDPREDSLYSGIRVKDQQSTGLCWAFSTTSVAERSYVRETGVSGASAELSPTQLGYFFFNGVTDKLGGTNGDKNLNQSENEWYNAGGYCMYTFQHLASWSGLAREDKVPFDDGKTKVYADELAYDDELVLENSEFYDACSVDTMKQLITEYGAVVGGMDYEDGTDEDGEENPEIPNFYNEKTSAFYNCDPEYNPGGNHEVTVVGWDDSFSRENFASRAGGSADIEKPEKDGAWIVQNSWGKEYGDGGYFYVSYEGPDLTGEGLCAYDMQPADSYDYNIQYDGNAADYLMTLSKGETVANVFSVPSGSEGIELSAFGLTEWNAGTVSYTADIYRNPTAGKPASGTRIATQSFKTDSSGFKTIKLDNPVYLLSGDTFSIVITTKSKKTAIGAESEDLDYGYAAGIQKGQSFYYDKKHKKWDDIAKYDYCFRIKAFADDADERGLAKATTITMKSVKALSGHKIRVTWNKAKGSSPASYTLYRATKKTGTYKAIKTVDGNKLTYTDKGKKGKTYYYKVQGTVNLTDGTTQTTRYSGVKSVRCR